MMVRYAVLCMSAVLLAGLNGASAQTQEEALVQELYGKQIADVKATATDADDVALAKQLLTAAADDNTSPKLKHVLARTTINVLSSAGSEEALGLARRALEIADRVQPLEPLERAAINKEIAARCFVRALDERKRPDQVAPLAREAAKAHIEYAQAALQNVEELDKGDASLIAAATLIQNYKLADLSESLSAVKKAVAAAKTRYGALQAALARLKAAQAAKNEGAIKAANKAVADVYLTHDGDLVSAAKYLVGTGDPREPTVTAAATFIAETKLDPAGAPETIQALAALAKGFPEEARAKVADCGLQMCKGYLGGKTTEIGAAKVRLLMVQLQEVCGVVAGEDLRKKIEAAYKGLNCKLEVLDEGRIRATYDFSDDKQVKDWDRISGTWAVGKHSLACKTEAYSSGEIANKLRFRTDRPFRISFAGGARYELTASLHMYGSSATYYSYYYQFMFTSSGGLYLYTYSNSWSDSKTRLQEGKIYKFEISGDGKGAVSWTINGALAREVKAPERLPPYLKGSFSLHLRTESSDRALTAFDDVVVEGEVVVNATKGN